MSMFTTTALIVGLVAAADAGAVVMNDGVPLAGFEKFLLTDAAKAGAVCTRRRQGRRRVGRPAVGTSGAAIRRSGSSSTR